MNPIITQSWTPEDLARWGARSIDAFTAEELALLQQKVALWIGQRGPQAGRIGRQRSFVSKPQSTDPA